MLSILWFLFLVSQQLAGMQLCICSVLLSDMREIKYVV